MEIGFHVKFVSKSAERPSYLPSKSTMAEWKSQLFMCKSIQNGIQLIADLKLTVFKILAFAEYL